MPRLLPILITLLLITVTVRIGDAAMQIVRGMKPELVPSEAQAQDADSAKTAEAKTDAKEPEAKDTAAKEPADAKTVIKDTTTDKVLSQKPPASVPEVDPFAPQFSDEELTVLQSLSKRRQQIDQRERDLDQREKLLQVAEKKVEQKVAELSALKKQLEDLLGKQQQAESDNIKQLVKIYENMKPKDAANIFNDLQGDVLLKIVSSMSERKSAAVLAAMDPLRARDLSARIAAMKALPQASQPPAVPQQ